MDLHRDRGRAVCLRDYIQSSLTAVKQYQSQAQVEGVSTTMPTMKGKMSDNENSNDRVADYLSSPLGQWMGIVVAAVNDIEDGCNPTTVIETAMREAVQLALETQ